MQALRLANCVWVAANDCARESIESAKRHGAAETVGRNAKTGLQLFKCSFGVGPEDAVDASWVKPEVVQAALQYGYVVTVLHMAGAVAQHSVAELPAGTIQPAPGRRPDDPIGDESALLLKGADRALGVVVERSVPAVFVTAWPVLREQTEQRQVITDLRYGRSVVAVSVVRLGHSTSGAVGPLSRRTVEKRDVRESNCAKRVTLRSRDPTAWNR